MRPHMRWSIWLTCLAGAGWLVATADQPGTPAAQSLPTRTARAHPGPDKAGPAPGAAAEAAPDTQLTPRTELYPVPPTARGAETARDLFSVRSWDPPARVVPPASAEAPTAPPVPYTVLGKKLEGQQWEVFLGRGDRTLLARAGAVLDGVYQVDRIDPPRLMLTYLPLGQAQLLPIGDPW